MVSCVLLSFFEPELVSDIFLSSNRGLRDRVSSEGDGYRCDCGSEESEDTPNRRRDPHEHVTGNSVAQAIGVL